MLGPLLFIIYICDLHIEEYEAIKSASYADDTTAFTYGQSFSEIIEKLEIYMSKICQLFHYNGSRADPGNLIFY